MFPLPFFRLNPFIAAGLILALAGCRSSAIVPRFTVVAGHRHPPPAQRFDTATAIIAPNFPTTPLGPVYPEGLPRVGHPRDHTEREQQEPVGKPGSRFARAISSDTATSSTRPVVPRKPRRPFKLFSAQTLVHYSLHFAFPAVLALVFFPLMWQTAYLILLATMLIDLDHLLAKPIFEPRRCSIGYHPLHSFYAVPVYAFLLLLPATQIVAVGILFHLFTDTVDCLWSFRHCHECYLNSRIYAVRNWVRKLLGREVVD